MATITADVAVAENEPRKAIAGGGEIDKAGEKDNHGLPRFFYAAAAALILSAIQGVVQRFPGISDWLLAADYGGHMVTNLAHTHITIVGAGTISLTGLIYYVLPRVTRRQLFSSTLTNVSFWCTIIGVFGFYLSMLGIGIYEGAMVHAGWAYDAARDYLGAWHKAPMAITAAIMGIGYWTFVTNVYVTVGQAAGERKIWPDKGPSNSEMLLAKFFVVGATGLLFGTIQGVYQVMPWSLDWLHATGNAGKMIDPMAHAHMNLVGGVSVALMGLLYFFVPKMLNRPMFSMKLAVFSFWCIVIGVFGFYFTAIGLGWAEGQMMLDKGVTDEVAKQSMGIWHPLLLSTAASIMGLGFWSFITNMLMTLKQKAAPGAPADGKLAWFLGFSTVAILIGTIQGVLQTLPFIEEWLEEGSPSSYFVTPLAHAQLNMVGFVIVALSTMMLFLLPRLLGKPVTFPERGQRALTVMAVGIASTYVVYFLVGVLESIQIHNGLAPDQARAAVFGDWGRYALLIGAQAILGAGYILLFRHVSSVIGKDVIREYWRTFRARMGQSIRNSSSIHPRAFPTSIGQARSRALLSALMEFVFLGLGWFFSGRPFIGTLMFTLGAFYLTIVYGVIALLGDAAFLPSALVYVGLLIFSAVSSYNTYMRDATAGLAR